MYRTKTSQKPAVPQLSEASALSSWATDAYIWKTPLQRISILWNRQFPIVVNSWSDYRWPPRFCERKSRCNEQKRVKNLPCRSCRRTTTGRYRLSLKREFCCLCTVATKTTKSPLLVITIGFSCFLWYDCTVVVKWWSKIQIIYFFKEKEFVKWVLDNTILAEQTLYGG